MGLPAFETTLSPADYLAWEAIQSDKHEYLNGEVFAMGGAARRHVTLSLNVASALDDLLEGKPCGVFIADMKVEVATASAFFYPDVLVTCDPADLRAEQVMRHPALILEVLSPSTAAFDRGDKFRAYRQLDSLREYVLLDPDRRSAEVFRRQPDNRWLLTDIQPETPLILDSLAVEIPWGRVFRNLD